MPQKKIDEIILKLLGHDDGVAIGNGYHDECQREAEEVKQALADHLLGLPSLQLVDDRYEVDEPVPIINYQQEALKQKIRHEIAEALGVDSQNA